MRTLILLLFPLLLAGCYETAPTKELVIGKGSRIDVLNSRHHFAPNHIPAGWVIEGRDKETVFSNRGKLPNIYMNRRDGVKGVHIQSGQADFVLARYQDTRVLVTPFLVWNWHVSEHKGLHHPVRLLVGFYGGNPQSPPLQGDRMVWHGDGLPPFDRVLAIGYDQTALKRGNLYPMGQVKYYVQRGGLEQTNRWHNEAVDLSLLYQQAWPTDHVGTAKITFIGMASTPSADDGGITFSTIDLIR
ncbi:hypothetical protein [Terasakiella pusilla]|uniref:hypothetical protein n=1 Tax=Terasakiella pusilla TaxID=64973 RepID=UPI003AA93ACE